MSTSSKLRESTERVFRWAQMPIIHGSWSFSAWSRRCAPSKNSSTANRQLHAHSGIEKLGTTNTRPQRPETINACSSGDQTKVRARYVGMGDNIMVDRVILERSF